MRGDVRCAGCGDVIDDGETFATISMGEVHYGEPQGHAGGGTFHPKCAREYIRTVFVEAEWAETSPERGASGGVVPRP